MDILPSIDQRGYAHMSTNELRQAFLVEGLFQPGGIVLKYWETDRTVIGGVMPGMDQLVLGCPRELASKYFNERRELGAINLGGAGTIAVDGKVYSLQTHDCLYIGRGAQSVSFTSADPARPAQFYLLSYPAHVAHPTALASFASTPGVELGAAATANARTIYKFIHTEGIKSCQLVMGMTVLKPGSVWNTMPPHTHLRRTEVYLYFDLPAEAAVFHFAGRPDETRSLLLHDRQAVLSPPWSIHCGVGTSNYTFIWGMGGENQEFADMDAAPIKALR
ncbi:MAG TPA: 5-dehydro-4-deoxy-D-glucuronate isomerase [Lacunisphaera sp.]|nr:5-dehydro-4-deoxy-D-glucuronate isomerase [Lacunisphaera sp.]